MLKVLEPWGGDRTSSTEYHNLFVVPAWAAQEILTLPFTTFGFDAAMTQLGHFAKDAGPLRFFVASQPG